MTQPRGWQDPSTDIENVNAAYRIEHELANHYREALEAIAASKWSSSVRDIEAAFQRAEEALAFDPLSREDRPS